MPTGGAKTLDYTHLLLPAVLLVVLGRGASVLAERLDREGTVDESP